MCGHESVCLCVGGTWCVCREGLSEAMLQKTLDYACGAGADCGPIHQNGPCFNPNTVKSHCSYAVNSFFQKKRQSQGTCDFAGTATVSASDPSESLPHQPLYFHSLNKVQNNVWTPSFKTKQFSLGYLIMSKKM